jgi:hypothetical protein
MEKEKVEKEKAREVIKRFHDRLMQTYINAINEPDDKFLMVAHVDAIIMLSLSVNNIDSSLKSIDEKMDHLIDAIDRR